MSRNICHLFLTCFIFVFVFIVVSAQRCSKGKESHSNSCYWQSKSRVNFKEAREFCTKDGGHPIVISSNSELRFATKQVSNGNIAWIGLKKKGGEFKWTNQEELNLANIPWVNGDPGDSGDCVITFSFNNINYWATRSCHSCYKVLCEQKVVETAPLEEPTTTTTTEVTIKAKRPDVITPASVSTRPQEPCPNDKWQLFNKKCYFFSEGEEIGTWFQTRDYCKKYKGDLVSVANVDEADFISLYLKRAGNAWFWMGLKLDTETGKFYWVDGTPLNYLQWAEGEPNNPVKEHCGSIELGRSEPGWLDSYCYSPRRFICKADWYKGEKPHIPVNLEPLIECGEKDWYRFQDTCFHVQSEKMDWKNGQKYCENNSGYLASVHTDEEVGFLLKLFRRIYPGDFRAWIGLNRLEDSSLSWSDETPYDYQQWQPGEPNDKDDKCVSMYIYSGFWNDEHCENEKRPSLCRRSKDQDLDWRTKFKTK